jgi:hypothetical protein
MSATSRVAGAVAAGYVLGRFKKLRLAVLVGSAMASPKFRSAAAGMIQDRLPGGTVVNTLTKEVGGKLVDVGKTAATSIVASRIDSLSQSLADRSQNLRKGPSDGQAGKSRAEEPEGGEAEEPADEYEEQEEAEQPEDEYEEQEEAEQPEDEYEEEEEQEGGEEPADEYEEEEGGEEPADEYEEQEGGQAEEPADEYEEEEEEGGQAEEPADEYEEQEEAEQPEDQNVQADDDASRDEEPEKPVARSPRRRRSASPAGRKRG